MKALLFPGQGVQKVGMMNFLLESDLEIKNLFTQTSNVLDFDLFELIKKGPEQKLNLTEYAQPAILATSVAIARKKATDLDFSYAAGLSLGEYSALVYTGCIDFNDAIKPVSYTHLTLPTILLV